MILQDSLAQGPTPDSTVANLQNTIVRILDTLGIDAEAAGQVAIKALLIIALTWLSLRVLRALTSRLLARYGADPLLTSDAEQRQRTMIQVLNSVGAVLIGVAAILSFLNLFINIGPLLAGVGVFGLAVSFGAQNLVKDVITGFFILLENQYDVGDIVEINGVAGAVEKMTLRIVALRDLDGVLHIIPNGSIERVGNKTSGWSRAVVDVGVAYKEDVDRVIQVLRSVGDEFWNDKNWRHILAETPVLLGVDALGDSAVVIRLLLKTQAGKHWDAKREMLRRVKNRFDAEGIEIPFPQRSVTLRNSPSTQSD